MDLLQQLLSLVGTALVLIIVGAGIVIAFGAAIIAGGN